MLGSLGYYAGKNLILEYRSADGDPKRLSTLAEELVQTRPDVLVAGWGTLAPKALKAATAIIPIVFVAVGDPLGAGLVKALGRPEGNLTGFSAQSSELKGKQLQLLMACIPGQKTIGAVLNPDTPYSALALKELKTAADRYGIRLELLEIRQPADFTAAKMDALTASGATSLFVIEDPLTSSMRTTIMREANRLRLPTITALVEYAAAGALMTYGADIRHMYGRAAEYVDKILKGIDPAHLPVQQPTKLQLVINLKTAKALGIEVPSTLLATADELIE
jgi:putative ABC transport system substrate-binding protein